LCSSSISGEIAGTEPDTERRLDMAKDKDPQAERAEDDVEGQIARKRSFGEDDVEGHVARKRSIDEDDDDAEGHRMH
jgi:hypothetical protein